VNVIPYPPSWHEPGRPVDRRVENLSGGMTLVEKLGQRNMNYGTVATEDRWSKCSGRPLGLGGWRLPELNLIPIQVIDPGKATVGFIHSFGVNLYSLLL